MRAFIILFGLTFIFGLTSFSQAKVKDKNVNNQLKSQEYMQWKFTPKWYYYSWYKTKVLGVSITVPGLGLHNNYVKKDKRNIKQEAPTIVAVTLNEKEATQQGDDTDVVYKQELTKFADRTVDIQYELTKSERDNLISQISKELLKYAKNGGENQHVNSISGEVLRIRANIKIIHESHMSNAKKRVAYIGFQEELTNILSMTLRLNNINKTLNL